MSERPTIAEIAEAIADGRAVDWEAVEAGPATDADRAAISRLKSLEQVASRRRPTGATPPRAGSAAAPTVLIGGDSTWHWGHLAILEKVGEGAFGDVYRAHDPKLARDVALKLVREPASQYVGATTAIEEGRLVARVRHPNVVTVYGADRLDGRVGVWMEFLHGQTLEQLLRTQGPFDAHSAADIGVHLARALAAVHDAGLVHRDVKAQNVMREPGGRLVLMDFGTGRERAGADDGAIENLAGTPLYAAPEVLRGDQATPRSDIYSLGVLLYHLVTAAYPVVARTLTELVAAHGTSVRTSLHEARPDLPPAFVAVVERATVRDPGARYDTAQGMEAALAATLSVEQPAQPSLSPPRHVGGIAAAIAVVVALILLGWLWLPTLFRRSPGPSGQQAAALAASPEPRADMASAQPVPAPVPASPARATPVTPWVLIGAFENRTGDPALDDGEIENVLERELVQWPHLKVAGQARISDALVQMRVPTSTRLSPQLAREVCLRDGGIQFLITGIVQKAGKAFTLRAELVTAADGAAIGTFEEKAADQEALPVAIRREALQLRALLGEQADPSAASRLHLERVTTPSMAALKLYTQGTLANIAGNPDTPDFALRERYFHRAIVADQGFAAAYLMLAITIKAQRGRLESEYGPFLESAVRLADTSSLTEIERELIEGVKRYWRAQQATNELQRTEARLAAHAFEAVLWVDPGNYFALTSLHSVNSILGIAFNAAEIRARSVAVRPLNFEANLSAAMLKMSEGDLRESVRYYDVAVRADPTNANPGFRVFPSYEAWARGDVQAASRDLDEAWASAQSLPAFERARVAAELTEMLLTIGRVKRATEVANAIPEDLPRFRVATIAKVLELQDERERLGALLLPHLDEPLAWQLRDFWVSAGRVDDARQLLARGQTSDPSVELHIAYVLGRNEEAVKFGEQYLAALKGGRPAPREIMTIARALRRLGDRDRAIRLLVPDASVSATVANSIWAGYRWLQLRADLAKLYRETGRTSEAQRIERDVLARLDAADTDFPLRVELNQRTSR